MSLDQSMTFGEMRTRVCERLGIADRSGTVAAPTTDTMELDMVDRAIHDATRLLWATLDPRTGRAVRMSFVTPIIEVTLAPAGGGPLNINGDPCRYRLPRGVHSAPIGRVGWRDPASPGCHGVVYDTSIDDVRRRTSSAGGCTGPPLYCAVWPSHDAPIAKGERPPLDWYFYPVPDRVLIVSARFKVDPIRLLDASDRGNWPALHDLTVVDLAVDQIVQSGGLTSAETAATSADRAQKSLVRSIEHDYDMRPRTAGRIGGGDGRDGAFDTTPGFEFESVGYVAL